MMRFDEIDATNTQKDPNSCDRSEPETLYVVTYPDGITIFNMSKEEVSEYVDDMLYCGFSGTFSVREQEEETDE